MLFFLSLIPGPEPRTDTLFQQRHVVMSILLLVRNYTPAHEQIVNDNWDVAQIARNAFDLEGKVVGTVGCGRIGYRVLQRLQGFDCKELLWFDYTDLPPGGFFVSSCVSCSRPGWVCVVNSVIDARIPNRCRQENQRSTC